MENVSIFLERTSPDVYNPRRGDSPKHVQNVIVTKRMMLGWKTDESSAHKESSSKLNTTPKDL